jgi:exonuclease SbcD
MRILHTSDWHLGRSLGEYRLLEDQTEFLGWLVDQVRTQEVDLVAIAGDIFDRAVPPAEAVAIFSQAVADIRAGGAEIAMIAGNHDSGERVAMFAGLTEASGVVVRGGYRKAMDVTVRDFADGPLAIVALPFLDPALAPSEMRELVRASEGRALTHDSVLASVLDEVWNQVPDGMRTLVLSHAFVRGGEPSGSERELAVGNAGYVAAKRFDGFSYVALGHLHLPQKVDGRHNLRYCGSPLPYSFSEHNNKEVLLIDLDSEGHATVEPLPIAVGRGLARVRGSFEELMASEVLLGEPYVRIELTDSAPVLDAHRRLRTIFPRLVEIDRVGMTQRNLPESRRAAAVRKLSASELAAAFWTEVTGEAPTDVEAELLVAALANESKPPIRLAS